SDHLANAAPAVCCTSLLALPSGTETTTAAAHTTTALALLAPALSTLDEPDADAVLLSAALLSAFPPTPPPSAIQTAHGCSPLSPAPLSPGSPAWPPATSARPVQRSYRQSLPAPLPAHPQTPRTSPLLPPSSVHCRLLLLAAAPAM